MAKSKVAIIGGGISGLFAAKLLTEKIAGKIEEIIIFEKESLPGGLISSTQKDGRLWDNGIFIFFEDSPLVQLFPSEFSIIEDHAQLAWNGKNFNEFPLSINTIVKNLPMTQIGFILGDYIVSRLRLKFKLTRSNFHDWLRYRLTKTILEYSMLENYIVKLQGKRPIELSDGLGMERFSDIDYSTRLINLLFRFYNSMIKPATERNIKPMYCFSRGAGSFADKLANICILKGIKIRYNCTIDSIAINPPKTLNLHISCDNLQYDYHTDFIIATNPINNLNDICRPLLQTENANYKKALSYKKLLLIFYAINKSLIKNRHLLLYSLDPNQPWKRLKAHSQPDNSTLLIIETPVDELHANQMDSIIQSVTNGLINELKLFRPEDILAIEHGFINEAYPIYELGHEEIALSIIDKLKKRNIFLCGRQGAYRYISSDKAILSASNAVDAILSNIE